MMNHRRLDGPDRPLWAYGYELTPPVARDRLGAMQAILDQGHAEALEEAEIWEARFVNGDRITHILIVSGSPAQDRSINRRVETELLRLQAKYSRSASLEILKSPRRGPSGRPPPGAPS